MKNQAKITQFRKVSNGAYQMELTETIDTRSSINSGNLLSEMNKGDDRFTASGPKGRKAWTKVTPEYAKEAFDIDLTSLSYDKDGKCEVSISAPKHTNGMNLVIKVSEGTNLQELGKACGKNEDTIALIASDKAKFAKHTPASEEREAQYFMKNGQFVYSFTTIVAVKEGNETPHELITDAELVAASEVFNNTTAKLADSIKA